MATGKLKVLQSADRLLGPWLCRYLKPTAKQLKSTVEATDREQRSRPIPPDEVRRILVIRPGGLGDAALTYPLLRALRQGYPDARVDVLAEKLAGLMAESKMNPVIKACDIEKDPFTILGENNDCCHKRTD